jgi:hypothetical protein
MLSASEAEDREMERQTAAESNISKKATPPNSTKIPSRYWKEH